VSSLCLSLSPQVYGLTDILSNSADVMTACGMLGDSRPAAEGAKEGDPSGGTPPAGEAREITTDDREASLLLLGGLGGLAGQRTASAYTAAADIMNSEMSVLLRYGLMPRSTTPCNGGLTSYLCPNC
jgi:hypothetical protein